MISLDLTDERECKAIDQVTNYYDTITMVSVAFIASIVYTRFFNHVPAVSVGELNTIGEATEIIL